MNIFKVLRRREIHVKFSKIFFKNIFFFLGNVATRDGRAKCFRIYVYARARARLRVLFLLRCTESGYAGIRIEIPPTIERGSPDGETRERRDWPALDVRRLDGRGIPPRFAPFRRESLIRPSFLLAVVIINHNHRCRAVNAANTVSRDTRRAARHWITRGLVANLDHFDHFYPPID